MRGHIEKRGKNSYSIAVSLGKDAATGKYKYQWVTVQGSKKDAQKRLSEMLHQLDTGSYMQPGKTTLAEYLDRWLADYVKPNLSPRGYERYRDIARTYLKPAMGSLLLTQVKAEHLQKCYTDWLNRGLSTGTVRYHHAVLHKALQTALKWGLVARNVADSVDMPRPKRREMQTWNETELAQFLEAAKGSQYYQLFFLALFTGMRRSELLALRWADVDLILGQIYVNRGLHHLKDGTYVFTQPKSARSRRKIALSPSAIRVLRDYYETRQMDASMMDLHLADDALIFSTFDGKPLRPNTVTRAWTMLAAKAGVKRIRFHDARHTHASLMLKQGIHPKIVQERLGHASISMTLDTYSHVAPGLQEAAAANFDQVLNNQNEKELVAN